MILQQFNWLANQIMSIYKHIFVYIETLAVSKLIRQNKKKTAFCFKLVLKSIIFLPSTTLKQTTA